MLPTLAWGAVRGHTRGGRPPFPVHSRPRWLLHFRYFLSGLQERILRPLLLKDQVLQFNSLGLESQSHPALLGLSFLICSMRMIKPALKGGWEGP